MGCGKITYFTCLKKKKKKKKIIIIIIVLPWEGGHGGGGLIVFFTMCLWQKGKKTEKHIYPVIRLKFLSSETAQKV